MMVRTARLHRVGWGLALLTLALACSILSTPPTATPDTQATLDAVVQATLTAAAVTPNATAPAATPTPQDNTPPPGGAAWAEPAFVWAYREDLAALVLYDAQGQTVLTVPVENPNMPAAPSMGVHTLGYIPPAGPYDQVMVALAAQHLDNKELVTTLDIAAPGGWRTEFQAPQSIAGLTGIPATPRLAYSLLSTSGYQHHSALYAHTVGQTPPTHSLWEMYSDEARFIVPVGMDTQGVWFTQGVFGAPIPPRGLAFVSGQGQHTPVLDAFLVAVDVPLGWVAYQTDGGAVAWQRIQSAPAPGLVGAPVTVPEPVFPTDQGVLYPGGAFATQYFAWEVFIGSPVDGAAYLRVYTLDGQPVAVQDANGPDPAAGVMEAAPAAWVRAPGTNEVRLVLRGYQENTSAPVLVFTTPDLSPGVVVPGVFMGVAYAQP